MAYMRLGDLLVASGTITGQQLERALALQKETKQRLGDVLIQNGFITEVQLIDALRVQLGVDFVDLTAISIPVELAQYVSRNIAKKYCVVPVKLVRNSLYLAMSDPLDFVAQDEVKTASRKRIIPMIATRKAVEQAISRLYGNEGTARVIEEMKREAGSSSDVIPAQMAQDTADPQESAPTIRFVNALIERAYTERASDIHLEPQEGEMVVRMRIDGLLRRILTVPADLQNTVISRLKIMGGMNIAEHKIPQDGHAIQSVRGHSLDLRISSMPTVYGEKMVLRLLDKSAQALSKSQLGLEGQDLDNYNALLRNTSGVILLVGPTGSGKSTTMCNMIRDLSREEINIVTLEDPVEYHIPGVSQCQINEKTGMTFASGLRAILRQDPDIISVGEIRDGETASIAMRAAITGHLVFSTLHTNDAVSAVYRLKDVGVVNLGHSATFLYIYRGGHFASRREIEVGMSDLEHLVADQCSVDIHVAHEYVRQNYNHVLESEQARELYGRIAVEVVKAVNFFNYNNRERELTQLCLCGGGSAIQPLYDTIADTTGMTLHTSAELLGQRMSTEEPWMYLRAIGGVDLGIKGGLR